MDILGIGFAEFLFIVVIAMMVFGPRRLPEVAAKAGKIVADLRNMSQGLMIEWQREINFAAELDEEIKKTRQELTGVKTELAQAKTNVLKDTTDVANAIAPPALVAQAASEPASSSNPTVVASSSTPAKPDDNTPADDPPTATAEPERVVTPANSPQSEPPSESSDEGSSPSVKTLPASVPRPPAAVRNGAGDASTQNPEQNLEQPVDEQ